MGKDTSRRQEGVFHFRWENERDLSYFETEGEGGEGVLDLVKFLGFLPCMLKPAPSCSREPMFKCSEILRTG